MFHNDYLTQSQVMTERGWSLSMIKRFMPEPCKREKNHINPHYAKLKLYSLRRIIQIEQTQAFQIAMIEKERRSVRMRRRRLEKEYEY